MSAGSEGHAEGDGGVLEEVSELVDEVVDEVDERDTLDVTSGAMQLQALLILELEASQLAKNAGHRVAAVMT